ENLYPAFFSQRDDGRLARTALRKHLAARIFKTKARADDTRTLYHRDGHGGRRPWQRCHQGRPTRGLDAIRHSSLGFFRMLGKTANDMFVDVTIAVPNPSSVDTEAVAKELPYGTR